MGFDLPDPIRLQMYDLVCASSRHPIGNALHKVFLEKNKNSIEKNKNPKKTKIKQLGWLVSEIDRKKRHKQSDC